MRSRKASESTTGIRNLRAFLPSGFRRNASPQELSFVVISSGACSLTSGLPGGSAVPCHRGTGAGDREVQIYDLRHVSPARLKHAAHLSLQ